MIDHEEIARIQREIEAEMDGWRKNPQFAAFCALLPEPKTHALIEFEFDGWGGPQHRCYFVRRTDKKNGFFSSASAGHLYHTDKEEGFNGEPILRQHEWLITEGIGYIGHQHTWEWVCWFIWNGLRGRLIHYVGD